MADSHAIDVHAMQNEWARLITFANFPDHQRVSTIRLAHSGFYYTGQGCVCRCVFCGFEDSDWTRGVIPPHCEEYLRRGRNEPIELHNRETYDEDSHDLLARSSIIPFNGEETRLNTASTHSFKQLWITINSNHVEQPLHLSDQDQTQSEIFEWLRIERNIYCSNSLNFQTSLNLDLGLRPSFEEHTNQSSNRANVFHYLRICEETRDQFLSYGSFTSNQSVREMMEGNTRQSSFSILSLSHPCSAQEQMSRVISPSQSSQEQTCQVTQPSETSDDHVTALNYLEESQMLQTSTEIADERGNVISQTEDVLSPSDIYDTSHETPLDEPTNEYEDSIPLRMSSDNSTCKSDQIWISIVGHDTMNLNRDNSPVNVKPNPNISESMTQATEVRERSIGENVPPMSRSVRNTTATPQTYSERLATFHNWPRHLAQHPEEMAAAGFYYTGQGDSVRCPYCDKGLYKWEPIDNPLTEHARFFPQCKFVQQYIHQRQHGQVRFCERNTCQKHV